MSNFSNKKRYLGFCKTFLSTGNFIQLFYPNFLPYELVSSWETITLKSMNGLYLI